MKVPTRSIEAVAEGDFDLAGTMGISREAPVGFENIRLRLQIDAPEATAEQIEALHEKTEQFCVIAQTLPTRRPWRPSGCQGSRETQPTRSSLARCPTSS